MTTIWKYELVVDDLNLLDMPDGAKVLSVQPQNGHVCLWALVDPSEPKKERAFRIYGTDHSIHNSDELAYVGTFQLHDGALVFHLFEVVP